MNYCYLFNFFFIIIRVVVSYYQNHKSTQLVFFSADKLKTQWLKTRRINPSHTSQESLANPLLFLYNSCLNWLMWQKDIMLNMLCHVFHDFHPALSSLSGSISLSQNIWWFKSKALIAWILILLTKELILLQMSLLNHCALLNYNIFQFWLEHYISNVRV